MGNNTPHASEYAHHAGLLNQQQQAERADMFTVKVVRIRDGEHSTSLYEARSVEIIDSGPVKAVIGHLVNGDDAYIPVKDPSEPEDEIAAVIFIENANGKTTDIVRA